MKYKPRYRVGDEVYMTSDAVENYGDRFDGVKLIITHVSNKYMPAKEFFTSGKPEGYHPGYDEGMEGMGLYDLKIKSTGEHLGMSLYDYELTI